MPPTKILAIVVLVGAVLALALAAVYFLCPQHFDAAVSEHPPQSLQEQEKTDDAILDKRKTYGFPLGVFEGLPSVPVDFSILAEKMHKGLYTNYAFFPKEYFLQPEFFPSFNGDTRVYWTSPSMTHYGAAGYGFYPSCQEVSLWPGETITAAFFVHAGFGVQNYQGLKVAAKNGYDGISTSIIEPEFVLGYSYPKFSNTWAKKIIVIVSAGRNALPGGYKLDFSAQAFPATEANSNRYFAGGGGSADISSTILVKVLNQQ